MHRDPDPSRVRSDVPPRAHCDLGKIRRPPPCLHIRRARRDLLTGSSRSNYEVGRIPVHRIFAAMGRKKQVAADEDAEMMEEFEELLQGDVDCEIDTEEEEEEEEEEEQEEEGEEKEGTGEKSSRKDEKGDSAQMPRVRATQDQTQRQKGVAAQPELASKSKLGSEVVAATIKLVGAVQGYIMHCCICLLSSKDLVTSKMDSLSHPRPPPRPRMWGGRGTSVAK